MYTNYNSLDDQISFKRVVAFIDPEISSNTLFPILKEREAEENQKLKINKYKSLDSIPKHTNPYENENGIINLEWIKSLTNIAPSTIIYYYYISSTNIREEHKKIYAEIQTVKNAYKNVPIILIIIKGNYMFTLEEQDILQLIDRNNIYVLNSNDSLKVNEINKMIKSLNLLTKAYFKNLKDNIKQYQSTTSNFEIECKCEIKLGIISFLRTKKKFNEKLKHFENAYNKLTKVDINKYFYGESNNIQSYIEIKNVGDWILNKIIKFNNNISFESIIKKYDNHFHFFSKFDFYSEDTNKNILYTFEYYWRYLKYNELINYIKINNQDNIYNDKFIFILLRAYYNIKRLNIFLSEYLNNNIQEDNSIIKLKTKFSIFYEKEPIYEKYDSPLIPIVVPFSPIIAIKKLILDNGINKDKLNTLMSELLSIYYETINNNKTNTELNRYMNLINNNNDYKTYLTIAGDQNLLKYPKVYYHYIQKCTDQLILHYNEDNKISKQNRNLLIENMIQLGNRRELTSKEEELFNVLNNMDLSEDSGSDNKEIINNIDINNNIFSIKLSIKNNQNLYKRVLDLVEYEITINTKLEKDSININDITLFFNNERKPKIFNQNFILNKLTPILLNYKVMLKDCDKLLYITKIQFKLQNNNDIIYEILLPKKLENTTIIKSLDKNVLMFNSPQLIKIGDNVYHNCEIEIKKDNSYNVQIGKLDIYFRSNILSNSMSIKQALNSSNEILFYNKENKPMNEYQITINNLEEYIKNNGNIISFLIKAKNIEKFNISYTTKYQILQKEVEDDSIELGYSGTIGFNVINPFTYKTDIFANTYMTAQKQTIYSTNNNIQETLILTNHLDKDIIIKNIQIEKTNKENNYEINTPITELLNIDPNILMFVKNSEYSIPLNLLFSKEFYGIPGKIIFEWTTKNLQKYSETIFNKNIFELTDIKVSELYLNFEYEINPISEGNYMCNIKVQNKKESMKKVVFQADISNEFIIQGFNKKNFILLPKEKKEFKLIFSPTDFGNIKLPPIKVIEFNMNSGDKLDSIYYFPDFLNININ